MSSDDILSSPTDAELDVAHSPLSSSSFESMNLPPDKMEQLVRNLRSENKQLQIRVLGVTELARLLQDRREKVKVLEDKNKRLEVAVVRLENRCANLEAKLRADGGGAPLSGPKSMHPPSIPGPSRQILEALMKENSELKKALNGMQKKGPSGYLDAVKHSQLEEVIDQQKQDLDFLRSQVNMLTTTPLPSSSSSSHASGGRSEGEKPGSSGQDGGGGEGGMLGDLRRQLIKLQHSLKVKDRFCSLLSDQVASLQDKMKHMKLDEDMPSKSPKHQPPSSSEAVPQEEIDKIRKEIEARYTAVIEGLKTTLQEERQEHTTSVEKQQKAEQENKRMSKEIADIDKRCEDLQFHNLTLLEDKKQLQEDLDRLRAERGGAPGGGAGGLERELRQLQDSLQQKVMEHSEEIRNKDKEMQQLRMMLEDMEYKYVIADSRLSQIQSEHEQNVMNLKDKIEDLESDVSAKQNEIEELKYGIRQQDMEMKSIRSRPHVVEEAALFPRDIPQQPIIPPLMLPHSMQSMVAVRDGVGQKEPTLARGPAPTHFEHCEISKPEYIPRPALVCRGPEGKDPQPVPPQQQPPGTLQLHNQPPPPRKLSPSPSPSSTIGAGPGPHPITTPGVGPGPHHPMTTPSSTHGGMTGRRSPLSPANVHTGGGGVPQLGGTPHSVQHPPRYPLGHNPAPTPSYHYNPVSTPMAYPTPRHLTHPHPRTLPPSTFDPSHMGGHYPGGRMGPGVPPQSGSPLPPGAVGHPMHRASSDPEARGAPPPHPYPGDPHHTHHTQRRN